MFKIILPSIKFKVERWKYNKLWRQLDYFFSF